MENSEISTLLRAIQETCPKAEFTKAVAAFWYQELHATEAAIIQEAWRRWRLDAVATGYPPRLRELLDLADTITREQRQQQRQGERSPEPLDFGALLEARASDHWAITHARLVSLGLIARGREQEAARYCREAVAQCPEGDEAYWLANALAYEESAGLAADKQAWRQHRDDWRRVIARWQAEAHAQAEAVPF